jgi:predicted metalloprotease
MRWQGGRKGGNIEDRRGMGPGKVAGGGIGILVIALIGYFVFGMEPEDVAKMISEQPGR